MRLSTVIVDRDGVINYDSEDFIKSPAEWQALPGSLEAIVRLKHEGLRVVVATNQSGIGRGLINYGALFAIHDKMTRLLADFGVALDGIFFCPHIAEDNCRCRKPRTGLLEDILKRWHIRPTEAVMIGDSPRDIAAAQAMKIQALGIRSNKPTKPSREHARDVARFENLSAAADWIVARRDTQ